MRNAVYVIGCCILLCAPLFAQHPEDDLISVMIPSDGWELEGDMMLPPGDAPVSVVLMLNQAAGDRTPYIGLMEHLRTRGIASLRLDLRGHGGSVNLGTFEPGKSRRDPMIWDAERDVIAAYRYLRSQPRFEGKFIGIVSSSYSGEETAEAGRLSGYADAYVVLSPGSFSDESIAAIDKSGVDWLFVWTKEDIYLTDIAASVRANSANVQMLELPGKKHATDILLDDPTVAEILAVWLSSRL